MELRNCAYPEPSHIHVPRPSRSDTNLEQLVDVEPVETQLLAETLTVDRDFCFRH